MSVAAAVISERFSFSYNQPVPLCCELIEHTEKDHKLK